MIRVSDIKAALLAWSQASAPAGFKILFDGQNRPGPDVSHIVLNPVLSVKRIGMEDEQIWDGDEGEYTIAAHRRIPCSIHSFGPGAVVALTCLDDALQAGPDYAAWFTARGLAAYTDGPVRNLSGLKGARFEQRAQMDLILTGLNAANAEGDPITSDPGYFDTVIYTAPDLGFPDPITISAPEGD